MYLKSLEIVGFKSFANKTTLTFDKSGKGPFSVTAIVGPNGSGKSNVSDAIRWVMGEQKMSKLRAKKSDDLIFGGSEHKGKMGLASVVMTLDNSDHRIDMPHEEIVLARKMYSTGESEYLINNAQVRLLDIQLLLAKAQFGHGSYSVVGQGVIDEMLLQSPADRKDFFDEAVGIKEFQIKRHQAALKMDRTREHITEAELLLNELTPRLKTLTRQMEKRAQREEIEAQLRGLQETYFGTLAHEYARRAALVREKLSGATMSYVATETELTGVQTELATLAKEESQRDAFGALEREYAQLMNKQHDLERQQAMLAGRKQSEYVNLGKQNIAWLNERLDTLKRDETQKQIDIDELSQLISQLETALSGSQAEYDQIQLERMQKKTALSNAERRLFESRSEQTVMQFSGLRAVQSLLDRGNDLGKVFGTLAHLGKVTPDFVQALDVAAGQYLSSLVVESDNVAQRSIEYLRERELGTATFLPLNTITSRPVPFDVGSLKRERGVCGLAIDLVEYDARFEQIFSFVFGSTLIVEDIDVARRIGFGRVRMVTLDGDIVERQGVMKGGYRKRGSDSLSFGRQGGVRGASSAAENEATVKTLHEEVAAIERDHMAVDMRLRNEQTELEMSRRERDLRLEALRAVEQERSKVEQELSLQNMSESEFAEIKKQFGTQEEEMQQQIAELGELVAQVQAKMASFQEAEEQKKRRVFALQDSMQQIQTRLSVLIQEKNSCEVELAKLTTKEEDVANELYQELHISLALLREREIAVVDMSTLESVQVEIQKCKYQLTLIGGIDEEVVREYEETKARHDGLSTQLADLHKALEDVTTLIEELDGMMKKRRDKAFKQIKKEFERYFAILFEGGSADLVEVYGEEGEKESSEVDGVEEVAEDAEVESSQKKTKKKKVLIGIDVVANPPGKKIKHIQSLSGGERTMTSIALVCAILRVNPSPFVVLDEVEAALDEANSLRLTRILHELSEASQFILITHNRATMHSADALYGVTMGNDGTSRLLSVKLEQAKQMSE